MKKVLIGLSGGVDSAVAAFLLKKEGFDVEGIFMEIWGGEDTGCGKPACYGPEEKDIEDVKKITEMLEIPLHIIDLKKEYKNIVLDYFKNEYLKGKTPNPCIVCNRFLKFEVLLEKALSSGIKTDYFATGHYAIVEYDENRKRYILKKGIDKEKDQSYFLYLLTQEQLSKVVFPLGKLKKENVREIARKNNLPVSEKEESQDFISGDRFFLFENGTKPGDIVDKNGNVLGKHRGIIYYTIGQRRGLGIAAGKPLYVIGIDAEKNRIVVGEEKNVYKRCLIAGNINFVSVDKVENGMNVEGKIRYKSPLSPASVFPYKNGKIIVKFDKPQWAITPGQSVVLYKKDELLFGGVIEKGVEDEEIDMYIKEGKG